MSAALRQFCAEFVCAIPYFYVMLNKDRTPPGVCCVKFSTKPPPHEAGIKKEK